MRCLCTVCLRNLNSLAPIPALTPTCICLCYYHGPSHLISFIRIIEGEKIIGGESASRVPHARLSSAKNRYRKLVRLLFLFCCTCRIYITTIQASFYVCVQRTVTWPTASSFERQSTRVFIKLVVYSPSRRRCHPATTFKHDYHPKVISTFTEAN